MISWKNAALLGAGLGGLALGGMMVAVLGPRYEYVIETKNGKARLRAWSASDLEKLKRECGCRLDQHGGD